jgi:hypothetical protein
LRKVAGIFLVLVTLFLLYKAHLGIGHRLKVNASRELTKAEVLLDKTPPSAPANLTGGPAPIVEHVASYLNRAPLTKHTMAPFDSTGGDLIVAAASSHNDDILTPSDNFNNTWISLSGPSNSRQGMNLRSQMWYVKNPKVGPNHIVTMSLSTGQALVISVFVIKGSDAANPLDAFSPITDDAGTQTLKPTGPTVTTTGANDLLIGFGKSALGETWSAGTGFTFQPAASSDFLVAESCGAAVPGNYAPSFSISTPSNWQAFMVAVRAAPPKASPSQITLAWQPASDNVGVAGYEIERCQGASCVDFRKIGTSKETAFVDSQFPSTTMYRYRVRALDAAANAGTYSNVISTQAGVGPD